MGYRKQPSTGQADTRVSAVRRVLWAILALNVSVALAKLLWGLVSGSVAMQADGFHSLFDGTGNIVGLVGMSFAARPADRDHPYGHGKYETYASALIAVLLIATATRVGWSAIDKFRDPGTPAQVGAVSFAVMFGTLAVNLLVTTWERRAGKRLGSEILIADAAHTASDVIVSLGVIVSLVFVRMGVELADPIVALFVAGAILFTAWGVFRQVSATFSDSARIPAGDIGEAAMEVDGVLGCHHIRTRGSAGEVYVDLHVQVDPYATVAQGHEVAESVERRVGDRFASVVDVIVHLEPYDEYQRTKTAEDADAGLA